MGYIVNYIESESLEVQGTIDSVKKRYKGYKIKELGKGNGNWLLTKNSDVLVNGKSYRDFVLDHYGKSKLTKKLVETFEKELNRGEVKI